MTILDQYLLRELIAPFGFAFGAFLVFWFVNIFFLAADYLINAHAPFFLLLRFLVLRIPQSTPYAFPFACLFASLLGYGRLAADNEITALRTAGIPFSRIAMPAFIAGFGVFLLSYFVSDNITLRPSSFRRGPSIRLFTIVQRSRSSRSFSAAM